MKALVFFVVGWLVGCSGRLCSQSLEQQLLERKPSCEEIFSNAMNVLPALKDNAAYDSIGFVINFTEKHCGKTIECFNLQILLTIQLGTFKVEDFFNPQTINNLEASASNVRSFKKLPPSPYQLQKSKYYTFTAAWAKDLLSNTRLDDNEQLICRTIAGEIADPFSVIAQNTANYRYLADLVQAYKKLQRETKVLVLALTGGVWIPSGDLQLLGVHPSLGLFTGIHYNKNEVDLAIQFRFLSSPHIYTVSRGGQLYDLNHFFGGYIGLDYTRYLVQNVDMEFGILGGIGYDSFDISDNKDYLDPQSIGNVNLNGGLRYNYYFSAHRFIGVTARYNLLNYRNKGGTSLSGNAFSLDLSIGL